ncbi:hypothetical protein A3F37_03535 [Candidatus Saccharibacteria bacterium RIFCSPHIGHO2_12_FULL_41_12]|nr:MAG: hypothetical protein A3F37_03535 [Candidatus Saccharibacteria bacterium RIFCSPHIGHO2_12_FULL_41_12]
MKKPLLILIITPILLIFLQASAQAVDLFRNNCNGSAADSAVCKDKKAVEKADASKNEDNPIFGPNGIITIITNILSAVVAIGAVISIVYAGMKLIFSGSNPQEANSARERIIYACVALVFVALAQIIVRFVINRL